MEKMKMETPNKVAENIKEILKLFPNCATEMLDKEKSTSEHKVYKEGINFELLKQMLSNNVVDGDEAYEFSWVGKKESIVEANTPIRKTLRPCKEESLNWDSTENLYIEGDNLEVLKLLQESYLGKVKMIYIDPPYNTGNDSLYRDNFKQGREEYAEEAGEIDEDGNRLFKNTDSNPRFHSVWCSVIYPRLMLARNLLSDDGVIFISIDDNEQDNLKKCCDEVWGKNNFIAQIIWERAYSPVNLMKHFSTSHDYILCYAKNIDIAICRGIHRNDTTNDRYSNPDNDSRGVWKASDLSVGPAVESNIYPIRTPSGRIVEPPAGRSWRLSEKAFSERLQDNRIWFGANGNNVPAMKRFLSELRKTGITPMTIWKYSEVDHSQGATQKLAKIFDGKKLFNYPKSVALLERCIQLYADSDDIILDFFSGSATTAHAVMQLNAEDGGKRRFIMVQLPEPCGENTEAYKAGYNNICEIGKERIRRAGRKIKEENADKPDIDKLDIGFRVFKVADSNMNDIYYSADAYTQDLLTQMESNIKADRTELDLLFGCLLDWGIPLSLPYTSETIDGCTVHDYNDGDLIACFSENVPESVIREIAHRQPLRAVFRDSSFGDSSAKINAVEIFKTLAPETRVKVI